MAKVRVMIAWRDLDKSEFVFGNKIVVGAQEAAQSWADGVDAPGLSVEQAEIIRDLADAGIVLVIDEDGTISTTDI